MPNTQVLEKSAQFNWLSNQPSRLVLTSLILFGALSYLEFLMEMIQYISALESCQATPVSISTKKDREIPRSPSPRQHVAGPHPPTSSSRWRVPLLLFSEP